MTDGLASAAICHVSHRGVGHVVCEAVPMIFEHPSRFLVVEILSSNAM